MSYPEHNPYHERRVDQQILDTLLRIEELLKAKDVEVIATSDITANGKPSITHTAPAPKAKRK